MLPSAVGREGEVAEGREGSTGVEEKERGWKTGDIKKKIKGRVRRHRNYKD